MSYRIFDGYMSPRTADGYVHVTENTASIYLFDGYNFEFFTNSGNITDGSEGIIYILNRIVPPTITPGGGGYLYAENGDGYWYNSAGIIQSISSTRISRQLTTDANYTAVQSDYQAKIMEFTSSVSLTLTRDIIIPITSGYQWIVFNNTTGGQSIRFIGNTGTGVTITNGTRAIIYADGTNIVEV